MATPPRQRVSAEDLRRRFNSGDYWRRAEAGEFVLVVKRLSTPATTSEPPGTRSQMVAYLDATGQQVALVHQYVRPDGTIGGSGRPDPKLLFEDGVTYYV